jgi:hypothetical protein
MKYLYKRCACRTTCRHPYWYRFKLLGELHRGTTRTANRQLAERIAQKVRETTVASHFGVS